jgi:gluconate 2-dehydrogenase gamma chain
MALDAREISTLRAAADRIVPGDAYPSASEAGVLEFFGRLIADEQLERTYRDGLAVIESESISRYGRGFAELAADDQDALLASIEESEAAPFFALLAEQTIEGYYADPGNGGNRDRVAWEMIGYHVTI